MTDRDLLEAAARAARYSLGRWWEMGEWHQIYQRYAGYGFPGHPWNPLVDDGDALRLAVKLGIVIDVGSVAAHAYKDGPGVVEIYGSDPYSATRRAIVRAAAAMDTQREEKQR